MKIKSALGLIRTVSLIFGALVVVIGLCAAFDCKSYGAYRRSVKDFIGLNTYSRGAKYGPVKPSPLKGRYVNPANKYGWGFDFGLMSLYALFVTPAFLLSVIIYGAQVGEPETCPKWLEIAHCGLGSIFVFIGGLFMFAAAVVPELKFKKGEILKHDHKVLGIDRKKWEVYMFDWDKEDLKFKIGNATKKAKRGASNSTIAQIMLETDMNDVLKLHRIDSNYLLKLIAGGLTILYAVMLIAQTVLVIRHMCNACCTRKQKVVPAVIIPDSVVVTQPEEPKEGEEGEGNLEEAEGNANHLPRTSNGPPS